MGSVDHTKNYDQFPQIQIDNNSIINTSFINTKQSITNTHQRQTDYSPIQKGERKRSQNSEFASRNIFKVNNKKPPQLIPGKDENFVKLKTLLEE